MNLGRACLAALILAPWVAIVGVMVVAHELLTRHRLWWVLAGCAVLAAAFEAGVIAYRALKTRPTVSRAEAVGHLEGHGWWPARSGLGPPSGA